MEIPPAVFYAILVGVSSASYSIFSKFSSTQISAPLGGMIIAAVALLTNMLVLLGFKLTGQHITFSPKGIGYILLTGIAAAGVDLFFLLAFSRGLKLSSSFITGATASSIILASSAILFREQFTLGRLIGILLIIAGVFTLQRFGI